VNAPFALTSESAGIIDLSIFDKDSAEYYTGYFEEAQV